MGFAGDSPGVDPPNAELGDDALGGGGLAPMSIGGSLPMSPSSCVSTRAPPAPCTSDDGSALWTHEAQSTDARETTLAEWIRTDGPLARRAPVALSGKNAPGGLDGQRSRVRVEERLADDGQNLINVLHTLYTGNRDFKRTVDASMRAAFGPD
jgi:hypothetical protein